MKHRMIAQRLGLDPDNPDHEPLPRVLPVGWELAEVTLDGAKWVNRRRGLSVIASVAEELDGRRWLHVSTARRSRLPSWEDLALVKRLFVGRDRKAIQVPPPEAEHVNINPFCLHLWALLEGDDPLPDFTRGSGSL